MKILRIVTRLNVGGPALQAISLLGEFPDSLLLTGVVPGNEKRIDYNNCIADRIIHFDNLKREISFKNDWKTFKEVKRIILQFNPDILHTHTSKAGFIGRFAALSIKKDRPKIVHTFHGHTFHSYFGWLKSFIFRRVEIFLAKRSDAIIAISDSQADELVDYGLPEKKIRVIPLGFDLTEFLKVEKFEFKRKMFFCMYTDYLPDCANCVVKENCTKDESKLKIGFVGRLAKIKNLRLFVEVVQKLKEKFNIEVYIAGDGEEREKLNPIKDLIIEQRWYSKEEMPDFYRKVDIVICTSYNEGTPVGLIEAMAAGKLVFAVNIGGIKDLLGRGERGMFLYNDMLNLSVSKLIESFENGKYKTLIDKAREYVRENHNKKRLVKDIDKLYRELNAR